jgi:hypothetical protein
MRVKTICARNNLRWSQRVNIVSTQHECKEAASVASTSCEWRDVPSLTNELLRSETSAKCEKSYNERRTAELQEWSNIRQKLLSSRIQMETPMHWNCVLCGQTTDSPVRCDDCSPFMQCCMKCETQLHRNSLHKPRIWQVRMKLSDACITQNTRILMTNQK